MDIPSARECWTDCNTLGSLSRTLCVCIDSTPSWTLLSKGCPGGGLCNHWSSLCILDHLCSHGLSVHSWRILAPSYNLRCSSSRFIHCHSRPTKPSRSFSELEGKRNVNSSHPYDFLCCLVGHARHPCTDWYRTITSISTCNGLWCRSRSLRPDDTSICLSFA